MRYPKNNYSPKEPFPAYAAMVRQHSATTTLRGSSINLFI